MIKNASTTQIANLYGFNKLSEIFSKVFFVESLIDFFSETEQVLVLTSIPYGNIIFGFKPLKTIRNTKYEDFKLLTGDTVINKKLEKFFKADINDYYKPFNYKGFIMPATMDL